MTSRSTIRKRSLLSLLFSILLGQCSIQSSDSFTVLRGGHSSSQNHLTRQLAEPDHNAENDDDETNAPHTTTSTEEPFNLDTFLDTPFFDPEAVDESSPYWLRSLAVFVRKDYATAELVLSGSFIALMILASQELVRMQMYGDQYEAFHGGVPSGGLF